MMSGLRTMKQWEVVIGIETHVQLSTQSKIFSGSSTAFGAAPNVQANAVDLALPGVLPVLNQAALRMAVTFGLAVDAHIAANRLCARPPMRVAAASEIGTATIGMSVARQLCNERNTTRITSNNASKSV